MRALSRTEQTFSRLRMMPDVVSSFSSDASRMPATRAMSKPWIGAAVFLASRQDGAPGQPGLRALQRQQLEQRASS